MAKQLNVNLSFTADTAKAKAQMQDLQRTLDALVKGSVAGSTASQMPITKSLTEAQVAATKLQTILKQTTNAQTGNLDLTKFSESLNKANMKLPALRQQLESLGPTGQKAFMSLAQSIMAADVPLRRTSGLVSELWTTMKNTVRWQLSSSVLHGFMGTISSAVGYAQDLDESLNNIRIVTGKNTEEMARFADQANKAAKSLSTTTTAYTNAALIYYQQGDETPEVLEKTDVTTKMANVTGTSAEEVSDQLTAIWNNFNKSGEESYEKYADILTALGAATASSTDEIAGGLEKFASIADMIGLSYEYAATALATITATTRQSEDVVGTALKTIFARIQGLNLGETLDDGTTLNKYSEALAKVGISIYDAGGGLKDMDAILDEMGSKWETLAEDQQVALAQTVAGVRQYNQLVSLMDNWDYFGENLSVAQNSEGELDKQQEIYEESWKAANERVKAAAQDLYDSILDEKFFIKLLDGFEKVLDVASVFADSLNGLPGILSMLGVVLTKVFSEQLSTSVNNIAFGIRSLTGYTKAAADELQNLAMKEVNNLSFNSGTEAGDAEATALKRKLHLQNEIKTIANNLTQEQREQLTDLLKINDAYSEQVIKLAAIKDAASDKVQDTSSKLRTQVKRANVDGTTQESRANEFNTARGELKNIVKEGVKAEGALAAINKNMNVKNAGNFSDALNKISKHLFDVGRTEAQSKFGALKKSFEGLAKSGKLTEKELNDFKAQLNDIVTSEGILEDATIQGADAFRASLSAYGLTQEQVDKLANEMMELVQAEKQSTQGAKVAQTAYSQLKTSIQGFKGALGSLGDNVVKTMQGISQLSMGIQSIIGAWDTLNNEDMSFGEKLLSVTMSLSMAIPALIGGLKALNAEQLKKNKADLIAIGNGIKDIAIKGGQTIGTWAQTAATKAETGSVWASVVAWIAKQAAMAPVLVITLALVAAIAAVVAVAALLVTAFKAIKNASPEAKLKAAEEEANRLAEELNKAKEASEELKDSIEGYDSAVDKIKTLKEGTEEWREAIEDANDAARKLIDGNEDQLAGKYHFNSETGLIEFDEGALKDLQKSADNKTKTVQSQYIAAQNDVLSAKTAVKNKEYVKENNISVGKVAGNVAGLGAAQATGAAMAATTLSTTFGAALSASVTAALPAIAGIIAGVAVAQKATDVAQTKALENLQQAYFETGGNFAEAIDRLGPANYALIESLGYTDTQLEELCQASRANTQAILENNKQIVHNRFEDNKDYQQATNKEYLDEVLAGDLKAETDKALVTQNNKTDKTIQQEYAELMGWDPDLVKNKSGYGVYKDAEGNDVEISDKEVRQYLAQEQALGALQGRVKETSESISKLTLYEKSLAKAADGSIESYEDYEKAMVAYGKSLGFTESEIDSFMSKHGSMTETVKKANLSKSFQSMGYTKDGSNKAAETLFAGMEDGIISKEQQMTIAVNIAATSDSYGEFLRNFEQQLNQSIVTAIQGASATVEGIMTTAEEDGNFDPSSIAALAEDEQFKEFMEASGREMLDFTSSNYSEKYAIIAEYYANLKQLEMEALETSKENYQRDLEEYQAILDYKNSLDENGNETEASKEIKDAWENIDFSAYADLDISDIKSKMDDVQEMIDEIDGQQIKLDLEWETTDVIENSIKKIGNFAKTLEKDAKKVGDSYQLTAAQAREWMQVYPELFEQADVTTDGLISLNGDYVSDFITGQEAASDAAIDANIKQLESRISVLEGEKAAYEADLELARSNAVGKEQLETASAEYLAETRDKLTQYYIDLGLDEVAAQKAALDTMGLNENEYSELVANAHTRNAENQIKSAEQGATGQVSVLGQLWNKIKEWAGKVGNLFKNVWGALTGKVEWSDVWDAWNGTSEISATTGVTGISAYDEKGNFITGSEAQRTAVLEEINAKSAAEIEAAIADIDGRIASIRSEILYNEALKNQDLSDYGSTDPDDVDGTKDSNKDKEKEEETLTEILERYHEINKEVETYERLLERISKQKDRAFGGKRLALIEDEIDATEKLYEKEKQLYDAQTAFLAYDQLAVQKEFANAQFDEYGNISNYTDLLKEANNALNQARTTFNGSAQEDADKKALEDAEKEYERLVEILEQYEETLKAWYEQEDRLIDLRNQIQDLNYEKLSYKLELEVIINDNELKELDYYFNKMEGDIEKAVEAFGLLKDKMEVTKDSLADYENHVTELEAAYAAGEISQAAYIEGLQNCYDSLYENLEALNELDEQMMDYYGETYDLALEKIEKYTSQLEHLNGVLDHYKSIMSLLGKETDFETMGVILEGQVETTRNSYEAAQSVYNMAKEQKEAAYKELQNAKTDEERELLQKNYDKAVEEFNNAQEEMLSSAEAYGQAIKDALVNSMEQAAKEMEEAMTGAWGSFESLQEQMSLHSERESEFLTTTNKLYETNKMLNQLAQDMEKTDNRAAKSKYAAFAKEIEQLQQKGKLSNLELEIAKAKYSVLQAQIALEEAKNAKSTVRLQRDSEGNFGYVYTADQDKIAQAEQDLADAENDLYNIRLDAANEYAEKLIQAKADLAARLKEIDERAAEDAEYREGQYAEDRQRILNEYYQTIGAYSELYGIATSEDARIVDEAWTSTYREVITDGEKWQNAVTGYTENITKAFETWEQRTDVLTDLVGKNLDETKGKVNDVTQASKDLKDELVKEVVPAVSTTLTNVRTLTTAYAAQRTQVLNLAKAYENLAKSIKKKIQAEAQEAIAETKTEDPTPQQPETPKTEEPKVEEPKTEEPAGNKLETASVTTQKGVAYAVWNGAWGNGSQRKSLLEQKFGSGAYETYQALVSQHNIAANAKGTGWIKDLGWSVSDPNVIKKLRDTYGPQAFFTGGYTGEWGAEGKLAFLHEKELVLNAEDTENLLTTITILRELMKAIDLNASWASMGIGMLNATGVSNNSQILEQQVEIHAEFPNATDRHEIEEAFTTLINRASQYANRF